MINKFTKYKITALILAFFALSGIANAQQITDTDPLEANLDVNVNLIVEGCDNDSVCEPITGEDTATCPLDCPAPVVTETPPTTPTDNRTPSGHRGSSGSSELIIQNLIYANTFSDISLSFSTNREAIASVQIGETSDYEKTTFVENSLRTKHSFVFNNLKSNTKYFYKITAVDKDNITNTFSGNVTTKSFFDVIDDFIDITFPGLSDPTNLKTITGNGIVTLTWDNPQVKDFDFIRIMKTLERDSPSPLDGELIYEGKSTILNDVGVNFDNRYFYTLFAKYKDGSYADGISISALVKTNRELENQKEDYQPIYGDDSLSIYDFSFIQDRKKLEWNNDSIFAISDEPIIIILKKQDYFGPLKDVFIELTFYDESGNAVYRNIYKLNYKSSIASYETVVSEIIAGQFITFEAYTIDENWYRNDVLGNIIIPSKASIEAYFDSNKRLDDITYSDFIKNFTNTVNNTQPWPLILLFALLSIIAWTVSKLLRFWK